MKKLTILFLTTFIVISAFAQNSRKVISMDTDWRFALGANPTASETSFDDTKWRILDIPHDWSIEGRYNKYNKTGRGGGYLPAGDGWYRKSFSLDESDKDKKIFIEFDGVMANSEVYINGKLLGIWPYGYTTFQYEMTGELKFGKTETNILTVRANNVDQPSSRWYSGAGIYRHVRMYIKNPVHIAQWGVYVTTPVATKTKATVKAAVQINNTSEKTKTITIQSSIVDKNGKTIKTSSINLKVTAKSTQKAEQTIQITNPLLWDIENPQLYKMVTRILDGKALLDDETTTFGIRTIRYDAAKGFFLNEKSLKMYGACMHHDGGGVGAAVPSGIWVYRLQKLKEAGINAIRTAHNPMAPEFYDVCDSLGFLVMDENFDTWNYVKNPYDYSRYFSEWWEKDTRAMVMRDRNHPSVVLYSVGNEIRDNLSTPEGFKKYKQQQDLVHTLDPTRPVTMALFRPGASGVYNNGFADIMDVVGQNYRPAELLAAHKQNPKRIVIGSENIHDQETYVALRDNEFMCGQFLWPGFDYMGESLWPKVTYESGLFNKAGGWNRNGLLRKSLWGSNPTVSVVRKSDNSGAGEWVSDWSPVDPITYDEAYLEIYTNAEEVELFLNGESLGVNKRPKNHGPIAKVINYKKGELRAEARTGGKVVATEVYKTAGSPYKIILTSHKSVIRNNREDISYVKATVVDKNGNRCPDADHLVRFKIEGVGKLIATDSGDFTSHESSKTNERTAYFGECYAIISANQDAGNIKISAEAEGIDGITEIVVIVKQ